MKIVNTDVLRIVDYGDNWIVVSSNDGDNVTCKFYSTGSDERIEKYKMTKKSLQHKLCNIRTEIHLEQRRR